MEDGRLIFTDFLDVSFQELVLGLAIADRDFLARARGILRPEYFAGHAYREICKALFTYWDEYHDLPSTEVLAVAVSGKISEPEARQATSDVVRRLSNLEEDDLDRPFIQGELALFCQRAAAAEVVHVASRDLKAFDISVLSKGLQKIEQMPIVFADLGVSVQNDWQLIYEEDLREVFPTGLLGFDQALRGGGRAGELIAFLAPMKRGKSLILINLGAALFKMGYLVIHYTLEMYKDDVLRRYLGCLTSCPVNSITRHTDTLRRMLKDLGTMTHGDVLIKEMPARSATMSMLEAHFNMVRAKYPDKKPVAVIDYIDLMATDNKKRAEWEQLDDLWIEGRNFARRQQTICLTASQTNAGGFNSSELGGEHQSGSTRKGFTVDAMFAVQQDKLDYASNRFRMVPFLNRHERKDMVTYWKARYDCSRIDEVTEDHYLMMGPPPGSSLLDRARDFTKEKKE